MRLGPLSKLYFNSATFEAPTWVELAVVSDLNVNPQWDADDSSTRQSRVKTEEVTMLGLEITGKCRKEIGDAAYLLLRTAFNTGAPIDVLCLDQSIALVGSDGFRFGAKAQQFGEDQSLGKVVFKDFNLKPCILLDSGGTVQPAKAALTTAPNTVAYGTIG